MMSTMDHWESYLVMFHYLDAFFFRHPEEHHRKLDDLAVVLGAMSPYIFAGGPADRAMWQEWLEVIGGAEQRFSETEAFASAVEYFRLMHHVNKWDIAFALEYLDKVDVGNPEDPEWQAWVTLCSIEKGRKAFLEPHERIRIPCPVCGAGIGVWICGDGETMVLICDECESHWLRPEAISTGQPFPQPKHPFMITEMQIPLSKAGVSRWATRDEIAERGWDLFLREEQDYVSDEDSGEIE